MDKTEQPEQWAVEVLDAVHDASDMGSACGMVDCPQCKAAALVIQRAFEERERKLREALSQLVDWVSRLDCECDSYHGHYCGRCKILGCTTLAALKETPHAPE